MSIPEGQHWIDHLQSDPSFAQLQAQLTGDFDRMVDSLLAASPDDAATTQRLIGEMRGLRYAIRTPARIARLAREANQ